MISNSAYSWWLYNAVPLGSQAASTMTQYPTQSHYLDLISPVYTDQQVSSNKYQVSKRIGLFDRERTTDLAPGRHVLYSQDH